MRWRPRPTNPHECRRVVPKQPWTPTKYNIACKVAQHPARMGPECSSPVQRQGRLGASLAPCDDSSLDVVVLRRSFFVFRRAGLRCVDASLPSGSSAGVVARNIVVLWGLGYRLAHACEKRWRRRCGQVAWAFGSGALDLGQKSQARPRITDGSSDPASPSDMCWDLHTPSARHPRGQWSASAAFSACRS